MAGDLAVAGRDADVTLAAIDQMAVSFGIEAISMKLEALEKVLVEARNANDTALMDKVSSQVSDLREARMNYEKIKGPMTVLEKNPADPAANFAVGRFNGFYLGDWDKGLPQLALGNEAAIKGLAERELAKPAESARQLELADGWWEVAQKQMGSMQNTVQRHAAEWYAKALPGLTGAAKTKAEKRISDAPKVKGEMRPQSPEAKANSTT
jgi:hypothetical protein